jgi:hypothetical protein
LAISTHVHQIIINFEKFVSTHGIFLNMHFFFIIFFDLKEIKGGFFLRDWDR